MGAKNMIKCDADKYVIRGTFTIDGLPGQFKDNPLKFAVINKKGELLSLCALDEDHNSGTGLCSRKEV